MVAESSEEKGGKYNPAIEDESLEHSVIRLTQTVSSEDHKLSEKFMQLQKQWSSLPVALRVQKCPFSRWPF